MPRLFTGIPISAEINGQLPALVPDSPDLRAVPVQNLHLTLHFLGDVSEGHASDLADALAEIPMPRVIVQLTTGGVFCQTAGAGVLWVGLQSDPAVQKLRDLQRQQRDVLLRLGLRCEDREWQPHVTVARFRRLNEPLVQQFLLNCSGLSLPTEMSECVLWESAAGQSHSTYTARRRYQTTSLS